jgi:hypothetical protein
MRQSRALKVAMIGRDASTSQPQANFHPHFRTDTWQRPVLLQVEDTPVAQIDVLRARHRPAYPLLTPPTIRTDLD